MRTIKRGNNILLVGITDVVLACIFEDTAVVYGKWGAWLAQQQKLFLESYGYRTKTTNEMYDKYLNKEGDGIEYL